MKIHEDRLNTEFVRTDIRNATYYVNLKDPALAFMPRGYDSNTRMHDLEQVQESSLLTTISRAVVRD